MGFIRCNLFIYCGKAPEKVSWQDLTNCRILKIIIVKIVPISLVLPKVYCKFDRI